MTHNPYETIYMVRTGSEAALKELMSEYASTIEMLAKTCIQQHAYYHVCYEDLIMEGNLALRQAAFNYREDTRASFYTFAVVLIKRRMWNCLRRHMHSLPCEPSYMIYYDDDENTAYSSMMACHDTDGDPAYMCRLNDAREALEKMMDELTDNERKICDELLQGKTRRSIIEKTGCTAKAYDGRLRRIRHKARDVLKDGQISA